MTKHHKLLQALSVLLLIFLISCNSQKPHKDTPVFVKTAEVKALPSTLSKNYPARISAAAEIKLSFRIAGPINEVYVDEGDFVKKGEIVAKIDPRDYKVQLQATEAKYKEVKAEVERITALYKKDKVSENDYDKAVSGLKQITAKYNAHKNALADTDLKAPFTGHINKIYFESGETVDAGMPVASLIDDQQYEIITHIPASDYLIKDQFTSFTCRSSNFPGKEWPLELRNIVAQANLNGLYPAYFKLNKDSEDTILPGMSAEVIIQYQTDEKILFEIPSSSVFESANESKVWVWDKNTSVISARVVEIQKIKTAGLAIVSGNLKENEVVVSAGVNSLREGQKVQPLPAPSESNIGNLL